MWGWGFYVGYPYSKTGIRGVFLYCLNGRNHRLITCLETVRFPFLVCAFATDFYFLNALLILLIYAACFSHYWLALAAIAGLFWSAPRYLSDVRKVRMPRRAKIKLAIVHYLTNLAFTFAAFAGALKHRVILIPSSVFCPDGPSRN
jgi:hypothetical protein